ncbi:UPF0313 protein [Bacteroidia bacterium]|nr:UPF0313 protein [Bacteroidia bacterium]
MTDRQCLPTSAKEVKERGWDSVDVILFSGDAYIDHPSFGAAIIGRLLESLGLKTAIVPQPNWQDDLRDFKKLGRPNLFFAISAGSMDSMVNHYTAAKRKRSDDAYTPQGRAGARPDRATIVYSRIIRDIYPDTPIVIGGVEASLRRFTHYDYWEDTLKPSILIESAADILIYGMGEKPLTELCKLLKKGIPFHNLTNIPQTCIVRKTNEKFAVHPAWQQIFLTPHEECLKDKKKYAQNFCTIEEESNKMEAAQLLQQNGDTLLIANPQYPPMSSGELDAVYALPFTRLPHPRYKDKEIPAYNMIRHSITLHRGCFGGCSFCSICAHQGKFISSRSPESIVKEAVKISEMPDFKGSISDLGGPSANMYAMAGKELDICRSCRKPSCTFPTICNNLNTDHAPLLRVYEQVGKLKGIKHSFIGSGIRYDLCLHKTKDAELNKRNETYLEVLLKEHVSGRLKVAPEHVVEHVLKCMRKPSFALFRQLKAFFDKINEKYNLQQQLIPYFMSSHPGCSPKDMEELALATKQLNFHLEQAQDFTPTPMTLATEMFYSGFDPYTLQPVKSAKTKEEKKHQNSFFFWYKSAPFKSHFFALFLSLCYG